jgi:hypothetical protein
MVDVRKRMEEQRLLRPRNRATALFQWSVLCWDSNGSAGQQCSALDECEWCCSIECLQILGRASMSAAAAATGSGERVAMPLEWRTLQQHFIPVSRVPHRCDIVVQPPRCCCSGITAASHSPSAIHCTHSSLQPNSAVPLHSRRHFSCRTALPRGGVWRDHTRRQE